MDLAHLNGFEIIMVGVVLVIVLLAAFKSNH